MGGLFSLVAKLFHSNSKRLSVAVTFVILSTALSKVQIPLGGEIVIGFSPPGVHDGGHGVLQRLRLF